MKIIFNHFNSFKRFKQLDKVTEYRLINMFFVAISLSIMAPIIITLKGSLMPVFIISLFAIGATLAVKTNKWFMKYSIGDLYKIGIFVHMLTILMAGLYFYNPVLMIYMESITVIIEVAVFSSFSIVLNNYITDYFPGSMKDFQIIRNSSWADGSLVGLSIAAVLTYLWPLEIVIIFFIVYNILFSLYMIKNWYFFDNISGSGVDAA